MISYGHFQTRNEYTLPDKWFLMTTWRNPFRGERVAKTGVGD